MAISLDPGHGEVDGNGHRGGDTQDVWRQVHEAAAHAELDGDQVAAVRGWVARRMATLPHVVFAPGGQMRTSFAVAIEHACRDVARRRVPE